MKGVRYYILVNFLTILLLLDVKSAGMRGLEDSIVMSPDVENTDKVIKKLYEKIDAKSYNLSYEAFHYAMLGYASMKEKAILRNDKIVTIIDFTKESCEKRFYTIDLEKKKIVFNTLVSHGKKSGVNFCTQFSDMPESHQSSIGFYTTGDVYYGKNRESLRLYGNEKGYNSNAYKRAVVIHGADYVSERFIRNNGYLGRSFGCPALPMNLHKEIIRKIKGGSLIFAYYNDSTYLKKSKFLKESHKILLLETMS